ncbi:hypothetical protein BJX61DRAFT_545213 [Aspergillus egyptiacus]|nr:hypothetical protein BJX61DRAFT_545213 [Aspergillus egyptiacus]
MDPNHVNAVAILTPAPGKKDRLQEVLVELIAQVEANEPETLQYQMFWSEGSQEFVFIEKYKNQEVLQAHAQTDYFKKVMEVGASEQLLAKPLEVKLFNLPVGGFAR